MDRFDFKTPVVRQAYEYWLSKLTGDRLPSRSDLKPEEVQHLLPCLYLVDVAREPLAFSFRLVGTAITRWAAREYTGVGVDEQSYGPYRKRVFDDYERVVRTHAPCYFEGPVPWPSREFQIHERIVLPLSPDGSAVNRLFGALCVIGPET